MYVGLEEKELTFLRPLRLKLPPNGTIILEFIPASGLQHGYIQG